MKGLKKLIITILVLALILGGLWVCFFDTAATVEPAQKPHSKQLTELSGVVKRVKTAIKTSPTTVELSADEVDALVNVASHHYPWVNLEVSLSRGFVTFDYSLKIKPGLYVNGGARVNETHPTQVAQARLGWLPVPSGLVNYFIKQFVAHLASLDAYHLATRQLSSMVITPQALSVKILMTEASSQELLKHLKNYGKAELENKNLSISRVEHYMRFFIAQSQTQAAKSQKHSLAFYLQRLIELSYGDKTGEPVITTGVLALALLNDSNLLHHILPVNKALAIQDIPIRLHRRRDLSKHFILSAAIKILADKGVSHSIGEAKELLDSSGGSGFSFKDLLADRAGVAFADKIAQLDFDDAAKAVVIPMISESNLMPKMDALEEGLSQEDFERMYGSTESELYKNMLALIDFEIDSSAIYVALDNQ